MSLIHLRQELHELIEKPDNSVVKAMCVVFVNLYMNKNNDIVGFKAAGEPFNQEDFITLIRNSYVAGKRGEVKDAE